ncbi:LOW QUALITY PROTEIN: uncharacterized protein [Temnothorax longispinosus]|uniref:LOW QUALITY PROTEIN: uncharacterized protein n=1 Tax=Temnothorax longispinosus TaxID=300112 RepID=UPI003A99E7E0
MAALDANWEKLKESHDDMMIAHWRALSEHDYIQEDFYAIAEETYLTQKSEFLDLLARFDRQSTDRPENAKPAEGAMRKTLPRILLPQFSGAYEDWPAFRDLFHSMVDRDASLEDVERLHYLKTSLTGEASTLIRNLPTTAESYPRAWTMLAEHYANTRLLVRACFTSFSSLPKMKNEAVGDLRKIFLINTFRIINTMGFLESIKRPITDCSDLFETAVSETAAPPLLDTLKSFLECRVRTLEALHPIPATKTDAQSTKPSSARSHAAVQKSKGADKCLLCQKEHYIFYCEDFRRKSPLQKREFAEQSKLCLNCYGRHTLDNCTSKRNCAACQGRHHSTMHDACSATAANVVAASTSLYVRQADGHVGKVLLATAKVDIRGAHDDLVAARALIDPGSEVSLVTEALAQRLRLPRFSAATIILGVCGKRTGRARGRVKLTIESRVTDATINVSVLVIPKITAHANHDGAAFPRWPHLERLPLADPDLQTAGAVELLLSADPGTPMAQNTKLGWLVSGLANYAKEGAAVTSCQCSIDDELPALVRKFWEQEKPEHPPLPLTEEEQRCEDLFTRTHVRLPSGRYMVRLPFRTTPPPDLSRTRDIALRVLHSVEYRGKKIPGLHEKYSKFMTEYEELEHMTRVHEKDDDKARPKCYLPHHGVLKGTGEEAKIRVVFNESTTPRHCLVSKRLEAHNSHHRGCAQTNVATHTGNNSPEVLDPTRTSTRATIHSPMCSMCAMAGGAPVTTNGKPSITKGHDVEGFRTHRRGLRRPNNAAHNKGSRPQGLQGLHCPFRVLVHESGAPRSGLRPHH